jgi:hypothetical protein
LAPVELQLVLACRDDPHGCGMALLLKTLSPIGYVPDAMPRIPGEVRSFVAGQLGLLWDPSEASVEHLDSHFLATASTID